MNKLEFVVQTPLKVKTRCTMLHPSFPSVLVVEGIVGVFKDSRSSVTPRLPLICKEGKHMVTMALLSCAMNQNAFQV